MKITTSELKQIIKEEAERFVKIKALEVEKDKITKQLNEIFEEESVAEESVAEESVAEESVAEESVAEESVAEESVAECGPMEESDAELEVNADIMEESIEEGIMDVFKNPRDEEGAKLLLKKDMEDVIVKSDAPEDVKSWAKSLVDKKIEAAGEKHNYNVIPALFQKRGADRGAGAAEAGKWMFSFKAGGPQTPIGKMLAALGAGAGEALRSENIEESKSVREIAREEAEKVAKVNQLKEKAEKIINEISSL